MECNLNYSNLLETCDGLEQLKHFFTLLLGAAVNGDMFNICSHR